MLRTGTEMVGFALAAVDGRIGKVEDFLLDEPEWTVRWIVADTGAWLPERKVLIPMITVGTPDCDSRQLPVRWTKEEIQNAPSLDFDAPVSREYEKRFYDQYGWEYYWRGAGRWGVASYPGKTFDRPEEKAMVKDSPERNEDVVRSMKELTGYHIEALDGTIGHIEDAMVEAPSWIVRYWVIDTRNWLPGRKVLIPSNWIANVDWEKRTVLVERSRKDIQESPEMKACARTGNLG